VSLESKILLIGAACKVCEYYGALGLQAQKDQLFIITAHFSRFLVHKSLK
jgi:hypothetical protein